MPLAIPKTGQPDPALEGDPVAHDLLISPALPGRERPATSKRGPSRGLQRVGGRGRRLWWRHTFSASSAHRLDAHRRPRVSSRSGRARKSCGCWTTGRTGVASGKPQRGARDDQRAVRHNRRLRVSSSQKLVAPSLAAPDQSAEGEGREEHDADHAGTSRYVNRRWVCQRRSAALAASAAAAAAAAWVQRDGCCSHPPRGSTALPRH